MESETNVESIIKKPRMGPVPNNPDKKLTGKQEKFVEEYLIDMNASAAARRSGYKASVSQKTGWGLLQKPHVQKALKARQLLAVEKSHVSPEWVLRKIAKTIAAAEAEGKHNEVLRGCELLGRHHSLFVDRTEVSGPDGDAIKHEEVTQNADDFTGSIARLVKRGGTSKET